MTTFAEAIRRRIYMEDVRCPGCGGMIPFPEGKMPVCPLCKCGVDVVDGGNGMWIVGLRQSPPPPPAEPHAADPLVRTYGKWKGIGMLMIAAGFILGAFLFIDLWGLYRGASFRFGTAHYILAAGGIVLALAGGILFLAGRAFKADRLRRLSGGQGKTGDVKSFVSGLRGRGLPLYF
jgi:hypothetical protein